MERWDLTSLPSSTEKEHPREPGADAPRVPRPEGQFPRVLFSTPECRGVVIELAAGQEMGDHHVRERAIVQVVSGRVAIHAAGETAECDEGTLAAFAPNERHSVRALDDATLLLLLAPWPAHSHYTDGAGDRDPQQLPANASVDPIAP